MKLFGSSSRNRKEPRESEPAIDKEEASPARKSNQRKKKKKRRGLRIFIILLCVLLTLESLYCFLVFTNIPSIKSLREAYIQTAMSTLSHQWLAEWFLPKYMVEDVVARVRQAEADQVGLTSSWETQATEPTEPNGQTPTDAPGNTDEARFYELFWELDRDSFEAYLEEHPGTLDNGWDKIKINASGLNDEGTSIRTTMDEQVLAIDAENQILLVRVEGSGYQGVLAVAKDPSQLHCAPSAYIGNYGQQLEDIVTNYDGILGMTGSGFIDPDGAGTGGLIAGYTMCHGKSYGSHYTLVGYKRIELRENNLLYIMDSTDDISDDVTDAVEFSPSLIIDGKFTSDGFDAWSGIQPRSCLGQSSRREILMLVIEGRLFGRSAGTTAEECAKIMERHDAYQAMNLDGGTSAVMWYDGQYVTKCSNEDIVSRLLPNAWVYGGDTTS